MFTLAELRELVEALGTLIAEYGETPVRRDLHERMRAELARRREEIAGGLW